MSSKKKWLSDIHRHEWYRDVKGRTWVVTMILYHEGKKDRVCLLEMGKSEDIVQPYDVIQEEIKAGRLKLFYT